MKKSKVILLLAAVMTATLIGCGDKGADSVSNQVVEEITINPVSTDLSADAAGENAEEAVEEETDVCPEGMYASELTGEYIDESLKDQRPIAVMVDNELTALPHYGLNDADIVYELMNSTMNGRISRFMVIKKDWKNIEQLGSVRSVRPSNFLIACEYNAIIIHDGGPFYINDFISRPYIDNLSGGFARYSNGKAQEYTEYVTSETYNNPTTGKSYPGLKDRVTQAKYSETYNSYYVGPHFSFVRSDIDLSSVDGSKKAENVDLSKGFPHNSSKLKYNADSKLYEYSEYGDPHIDPLDNNNVLAFKNVILMSVDFSQLDEHGYLAYHNIGEGDGYYIVNGNAIPIKWSKEQDLAITQYTNAKTGEPIDLQAGKTYIAFIPGDSWSGIVVE